MLARLAIAITALTLSAGAAQANDLAPVPLSQHPAVLIKARAVVIDSNRFIVQPPASVRWSRAHSNGEHPAVLVARHAAGIDSNTFQVQPPASTTWTLGPAVAAPLVVAIGR